jgi:preprotein translocase subunit SecF
MSPLNKARISEAIKDTLTAAAVTLVLWLLVDAALTVMGGH